MSHASTSPITNVADTAFWVAAARAHESERPDALFHEPYARQGEFYQSEVFTPAQMRCFMSPMPDCLQTSGGKPF